MWKDSPPSFIPKKEWNCVIQLLWDWLANFNYTAVLSTTVIMLYIKPWELNHLISEKFICFTNLSPFLLTPSPRQPLFYIVSRNWIFSLGIHIQVIPFVFLYMAHIMPSRSIIWNGRISYHGWISHRVCVCVCVCARARACMRAHHIFFIHFSMDGHLDCFHILATMNNTTLNSMNV